MKNLALIFLSIIPLFLSAQEEPLRIVEKKALFKKCLKFSSEIEREQCTNESILNYIYQNVVYPDSALQQEIEGMVVVEMVIGKSGRVTGAKLLKDIGGGCGDEVLRVINGLAQVEGLWLPALNKDIPVDYAMTIPVKFLIPEPPAPPLPYQIFGADTIYHEYSEYPVYGESIQNLEKLLLEELEYPPNYQDSCVVGTMVAQVVIGNAGQLKIIEIIDYSNLGFDFQFQLIQLLNASYGKWKPGTYDGKAVNVFHNIRVLFSPKSQACQTMASNFASANEIARQAELKYAEGKTDEAIAEWTQSIALFPNNAEYRLQRGQALLESGKNALQCCQDLNIAKENVTLTPLLSSSLPFICSQAMKDSLDLNEKP